MDQDTTLFRAVEQQAKVSWHVWLSRPSFRRPVTTRPELPPEAKA
jgi:hypothetical protein